MHLNFVFLIQILMFSIYIFFTFYLYLIFISHNLDYQQRDERHHNDNESISSSTTTTSSSSSIYICKSDFLSNNFKTIEHDIEKN